MAKYLISFPSAAMVVPDGGLEAVGRDAQAVIDEAKAANMSMMIGKPVRVAGSVWRSGLARRWATPANQTAFRGFR